VIFVCSRKIGTAEDEGTECRSGGYAQGCSGFNDGPESHVEFSALVQSVRETDTGTGDTEESHREKELVIRYTPLGKETYPQRELFPETDVEIS